MRRIEVSLMSSNVNVKPVVSDSALDRLLRKARSFNDFTAQPVTDAELRALYELAKWGPTTANSQPQRIVFVRSAAAKERLQPALSSQNKNKAAGAPVVAIMAYDMRFFEHLPRLFHNPHARSWYETTPDHIRTTALRNATLQGAYLMLAARAIGLDCGPMSGFKNEVVDAEFFPDGRFRSNFLCCIGHGDPSTLPVQDYRFAFDEVCSVL
jgi:3-hydroxypropanoate dehydrogenase